MIGTGVWRGRARLCATLALILIPPTITRADTECGAPVGGVVVCGPGSFNSGITYLGPFGGSFDLTSVAGTDTTFIDYSGDDATVSVVNQGAINSPQGAAPWGLQVLTSSGAVNSISLLNSGTITVDIGVGMTLIDQASGALQPVPLSIINEGSIVSEQDGIFARVQNNIEIFNRGALTTTSGHGIEVSVETKQAITVGVGVSDTIHGMKGRTGGVYLHSTEKVFTGSVTVSSRIDMDGAGAIGVWVVGGTGHTVKLVGGSVVEGGWGTGPKGELSAGLYFETDGSLNTVTADGSLRALSDRAIYSTGDSRELIGVGGVMLGFIDLGAGPDRLNITNAAGGWGIRNWADTDGDGNRDFEGVAFSTFGPGEDFLDLDGGNLGLASLAKNPTINNSGQVYSPDGLGDINAEFVEQGQILGLETFRNAGIITLMDSETGGKGPVTGDILVISQLDSFSKQKQPYVGGTGYYISDGGELHLDTYLDSGIVDQTDLLIVDNTTLGKTGLPTRVFIANAGGPGGATGSGPTDGILVVQVLGASDPGAFKLGAPVVAGAYQYELNQADAQNWYLQSSLFQEVLTYPAANVAAVAAWFADLRPLHERMGVAREQLRIGEIADAGQLAALGADDGAQQAVLPGAGDGISDALWFRVTGDQMRIDTGAGFDQTTVKGEVGYDMGFRDLMAKDDLLLVGGFGGLGQSSVDFDGDTSIDYQVYTAGLYATYGIGGFFVDSVVKGDWLQGDYNGVSTGGEDAGYNVGVLGASLEIGYRQDLFGGGIFVEPQGQLAYAHNWSGDFADAAGETVDLQDGDSLRGRLGGRIGTTILAGGTHLGFYFEGNLLHDFVGTQSATVSGVTFKQDPAGNAIELGGGLRVLDRGGHLSLFLDGDYVTGKDQQGVNLVGGVRVSW